ncbi:short-chain dehydrogenase [Cupriavidus sp. SHE]|jgi:NAD(P)-dependent dehydrogenase (short-subunit alcohol dehydrogenase family)|uniref:SDR family oxidoreductase n=1 Tax=Cupriavidus metallidurans TaxID=119219 RepID=A0A482IYM6_9BURK|nr:MULTISPECIES: SDR family oxidoreductase [Cupriavidus]KWR76320.1 short-chain dehydrogenase [Cupriavidus sp. SHE]QBP11790.1 SDR family oxidoreductase [Cupriavidus metallidurans]
MTEGKLAGKVAIVTGAGNGLGAHCATVLAEHGARVAVVDIRLDAAREVVAAIEAKGGTAMAVETDVSAEDAIRRMVAAVVEQWGRIDVLHNNAAALDLKTRYADRDVCNVEIEAWDRSMDVNARGAMLCCKHVIPVMLRNGGGSVIHSSSGFGVMGDATLTSYACSKAALLALSRMVAAQYGKQGVRSNALVIGFVLNEHAQKEVPEEIKQILLAQHLTPELGSPRQIADVVAFLASDESAFVTGHTMMVDGGFTSHAPSLVPIRELFARKGDNKW